MCTAGMRLLAETAPQHAVAILDSVRRYLGASGFKFDHKWALILPGQSEGVFAWISTNYLLRSLSTRSKTAAALDMGGASQVRFAVGKARLHLIFSRSLNSSVNGSVCLILSAGAECVFESLFLHLAFVCHCANPCA